MDRHTLLFATFLISLAGTSTARSTQGVLAQTETGWVRGTRRTAQNGQEYASFRGIPYAEQPIGELRFKELQPAVPWDGILNATTEGPICPYPAGGELVYGPLLQPHGVSEACIFINVHVPIHALPKRSASSSGGLPIVVHIHGGGWLVGSGDADILGPEYLMDKGVIVVTFNYRLNAPGYLSLNNAKIPGNNALRDALTALRWVQANARYFGGNPEEVTLSGQSAGATNAHLLALSPASKGLFNKVWLLSSTAIQSFYTASPDYAKKAADLLLSTLGIVSTDEDEIYEQLINTPIENLTEASGLVAAQTGVVSFAPVVETELPGITTIIPEDPEVLMAQGNGNDIPMVISFTNSESETLRPALEAGNVIAGYELDPTIAVYRGLVYSLSENKTAEIAERMKERYFSEIPTIEEYLRMYTDSIFTYPSIRTARTRVNSGGTPVYLCKFGYEVQYSPFKQAFNLTYSGAGHTEDMDRIFKVNSWPVPYSSADEAVNELMSNLFANFVKYGDPSYNDVSWSPNAYDQYFYIGSADDRQYVEISQYDREVVEFYDAMLEIANNTEQ